MNNLICCERVGYKQRGEEILVDVNWQIERGQHWAVLGPNGSGKTTLLRIACGYLWPTSGRVLRLGQELIDLSELRRCIGWISSGLVAEIPPDDTGLETVVTGRFAQIGLKRLPMGGPTAADYLDAAAELERIGCESLAEKRFGILSQGERQQVLIARARMAGPLLLVLDEPCAGMDPGVRERFLQWLGEHVNNEARINDEARMTNDESGASAIDIRRSSLGHFPTVILVTHHVEEIVPGISNTLILRAGRVHSAGRTSEVVTRETIEAVYQTRLARIEQSGDRLWPIWGDPHAS
jgi:iron complex transport system ATP-binding protein